MAQYFRDSKGQMHEFPDDATPEEIDAATRELDPPRNASQQVQSKAANSSAFAGMIAGRRKPEKTYMRKVSESLAGAVGGSPAVADTLDSLQHHIVNPLHGLAQFTSHALGLGSAAKDDAALLQREESYQAHNGNSAGAYAGAAVGDALPWLYGLGELRAAGLLPKVTATGIKGVAAKGGLLAAEGAAMGLAQPVVEKGRYGKQKAAQVAIGAAAAPALAAGLRGVAATGGAVRQVARYATEGGREQLANQRVAKMLGTDQGTLAALRNAPSIPGYSPSPAQALATPEAVQAERVLRNNGLTAPAFAAQESANNAALRGQVAGLAGTDADVTAAKAARKAATDPYYAQLTGQRVDPSSILAALESLNNSSLGVRPNIKSAAGSLRAEIQSRLGPDGKIGADVLSGLHENAGSHLGPMASAQEKAALGPLRNTIAETLDAAVPGYRDNLAAYARASQPLTDMAAGRALLDAIDSGGRDAGGNQAVSLTQVKSLLAKDAKAKYRMSPQARRQLEAIRDTLQQRSVTNNTIAASGPGTAADSLRGLGMSPLLQRLFGQVGGVAGGALGGAPGYGIGLALAEGANAANNAVVRKVGQKAANSKLAADAIEAYQRQLKNKGGLLGGQGMPEYLLPYMLNNQ